MILRYTVDDAGAARLVINEGEKLVSAPASYEHDSLRDLLAGTVAILEGASQVGIVLVDEPGEGHLNIRRVERGRIELQLVRHSGWKVWDGTSWARPGSKADVRFSCASTLWELREQLLASCEAIAAQFGARSDRRRREFPLELLERLRTMDLRIRFERGELTLQCCGQRVMMKASSLHDLLSKTAALVEGGREATVFFLGDEGEHQLKLRRTADDRVTLEAVWWWNQRDDDYGTVDFLCETRIGHLRAEVVAAAGEPAT